MSETSRIVTLKRMDVLCCHLTVQQTGQFTPWRTGEQPVGGERAVAWARGWHRRRVTLNGPPNHVVNVMHRDLPLAKIGCSKLSLIDAGCTCLTRLCLPVLRLCPYAHLKMKQGRHTLSSEKGEMYLLIVFLCVWMLVRPTSPYSGLIKESTVSVSLEI